MVVNNCLHYKGGRYLTSGDLAMLTLASTRIKEKDIKTGFDKSPTVVLEKRLRFPRQKIV